MWATFEHSWRLLSDEERQVFARLSVFRGGFDERAAVEVAQASPQLLAALLDKSLLRWNGVARYDMHELVRQYASEKLAEASETDPVRYQHLAYFLQLAEQAEQELTGQRQIPWLRRLDDELDNMRAALKWSAAHDVESGLLLASALGSYWQLHSPLQEGIGWLAHLLRQPEAAVRTVARAKALIHLGGLNIDHNAFTEARSLAEEGLALYRDLANHQGVAWALCLLGTARSFQENPVVVYPLMDESLMHFRSLGDTVGQAIVLNWMGSVNQYDYSRAHTYLEESLALYRERGHIAGMTHVLSDLAALALWHRDYTGAYERLQEALRWQQSLNIAGKDFNIISTLGELALRQGDYAQARVYYEESVVLSLASGQTMESLWSLVKLGYVALQQGDKVRASTLFAQTQQRFHEAGDLVGVVYAVEGLASLAVAQGQPERAVELFAWADFMRTAIGDPRPPVEQDDVDQDFAVIRSQLDEATFAAACAAGQAMTLQEAIAYALEGSELSSASSIATEAPQ
jgi:tetratricopeptide (TPR) repeat protein